MTTEKTYERGTGVDKLILDRVGEEISLPPGTLVTRQGDPPDFFYVILSGRLQVFRETGDGIRTHLTDLKEGDYFGEVALVTGQPRSASVETLTETRLLRIRQEEFDQVLDNNPKLARHIIRQLANWLLSGDQRLEKETVHRVKSRQVSWFDYVLILGLSLIFALIFNTYNDNQIPLFYHPGPAVAEIPLDAALEAYHKKQALFVDARKNSFYRQAHIKDALNLQVIFFDLMFPMFQFGLESLQVPKDQLIIVYGGSLSRRFDLELANLLQAKGYSKVKVLGGKSTAWQQVFPLVRQPSLALAQAPLGIPGYLEWVPVSIFLLFLIPPVRRSPYLAVFCRLILGAIFIQFALSKIMRPAVFALNVVEYGLMPAWGVNLWALFLPWAELLAGLFLVLGIRSRAAATIIGGMNIIFMVGLINAILQNLPINCGCVGEVGEPVNWLKVLKNAGMLLMCVQIFLYDRIFVLDRGGFIWRAREI